MSWPSSLPTKKVKCFCLGLNNFCPDSKVYSQKPGPFYCRVWAPCRALLLVIPEHRGTMMWDGNTDSAMKSSGSGTLTATSRIMHLVSRKLVEKTSNNKSSIDPSCPKWLHRPVQFAAWLAASCRGLLISWLVSDYAAPELSNVGVMCSVLTILTIHRETGGNNHTGKSFHKKKLDLYSR